MVVVRVISELNSGSDRSLRGESGIWRSRDALCDATGKRIWHLGAQGCVMPRYWEENLVSGSGLRELPWLARVRVRTSYPRGHMHVRFSQLHGAASATPFFLFTTRVVEEFSSMG